MLLAIIIGFSGTLLEIVRWKGMENIISEASSGATESVLSYYVPELWEQYHVYGLSKEHNEEELMCKYVQNGMQGYDGLLQTKGLDYYQGKVLGFDSIQEKRLTDNDGEDFIRQAIRYEMIHMPGKIINEGLEQLLSQAENVDETAEETIINDSEKAIEKANEIQKKQEGEKEEREKQEGEKEIEIQEKEKNKFESVENPFSFFKRQKTSLLFTQVLEDPSKSSHLSIEEETCIWNRELEHGNWEAPVAEGTSDKLTINPIEKFLLSLYTLDHFAYFGQEKNNRGLNYQVESIITGKVDDQKSLEGIVLRMLAIREGINFAYLITTPSKNQEAMAFATALVGFTGIPPLIEAVKLGILMIWAYTETISELKALMKGETIPLFKTDANFHSSLTNLSGSLTGGSWENEPGLKLSYPVFLTVFLVLRNQRKMGLGILNCVDCDLKKWRNNQQGIDCFRTRIQGTLKVNIPPVFQIMLQNTDNPKLKLEEERKCEIGYIH